MKNEIVTSTTNGTNTDSTSLDIVSRINTLHEKAEALSKLAKDKAQEAIKVAIECGKLLVEQRDSMKHGDWLPWLGTNCNFTPRTAQRYIKLFASVSAFEDGKPVSQVRDSSNATPVSYLDSETDNTESDNTENFIEKLPAKTLKDAYIATGILPPRKEPELKQDDLPETYKVEHVSFIDGFVKWYRKFKEQYPLDKMTNTTIDTLLLDLTAIVRIYRELNDEKQNRKSDNN